eukprot:7053046-Pyramimonas_sp.AAC.1
MNRVLVRACRPGWMRRSSRLGPSCSNGLRPRSSDGCRSCASTSTRSSAEGPREGQAGLMG